MNTYVVTMHKVVSFDFIVKADTPEEAEHKANDEARINGVPDHGYANWETISVEEQRNDTATT